MRNVFYIAATLVCAVAIFASMQQSHDMPVEIQIECIETPTATHADGTIDDWVIKPTVHLISAPADGWGEESASQPSIGDVADAVADAKTQFTTANLTIQQRLDELERQMAEAKSDIVDLSNGQADLTKRVEELTALVEIRTKSGETKTKAVAVSASGSQFLLAPGEVITHIDGVAIAPVRASNGGSNGSFSASTSTTTQYGSAPPTTSSGGSNGSLSYSAQTYQTQSYNVSSQPVGTQQQVSIAPRRPLQQLRNNGPLRTRLAPQSTQQAPPVCFGPNCPN